MSFLSKIFSYVPAEERKGISLAGKPCWEISGVKDFPLFLRTIHLITPTDSILYLEGGDTPAKLRSYLIQRPAKNTCNVEMGTIWPRPDRFHMEINKENLEGLAKIVETFTEPQIATHLHVYKNGQMILQWYDAFYDPMYVTKDILEESIKLFCNMLNAEYKVLDK